MSIPEKIATLDTAVRDATEVRVTEIDIVWPDGETEAEAHVKYQFGTVDGDGNFVPDPMLGPQRTILPPGDVSPKLLTAAGNVQPDSGLGIAKTHAEGLS